MEEGNECATDDEATFVPMSEKNMKLMNAKLDDDSIITDPDWVIIGGLLGGLMFLITGLIYFIHKFRHEAWETGHYRAPEYRERARNANFSKLAARESAIKKRGSLAKSSATIAPGAGEDQEVDAEEGKLHDDVDDGEFAINEGALGGDELLKQLLKHHDDVEKKFLGQNDMISNLKEALQGEADDQRRNLSTMMHQNAGDDASSADKRNALIALKQAMGARRVHENAIQQVEKAVAGKLSRLTELIERGPDVLGKQIITEISKEDYMDNTPPDESKILAEMVEELESLRTMVQTRLLPNLEKEARRFNIANSVWENANAVSSMDTDLSAAVAAVNDATSTNDATTRRFSDLFNTLRSASQTLRKS
jgi:polyhydroxyalkanoate synthesis regulator phasin